MTDTTEKPRRGSPGGRRRAEILPPDERKRIATLGAEGANASKLRKKLVKLQSDYPQTAERFGRLLAEAGIFDLGTADYEGLKRAYRLWVIASKERSEA